MAINELKPLSMAEAKEIAEASESETSKKLVLFIKKFSKLNSKEARELRKELEEMDVSKLKEEYIVKIMDILPEDAQDLNKIFIDTSLDENEINKILGAVKKYR